jgi:hypothetical protein
VLKASDGNDDASDCPGGREQEVLRQELTDQTAPARAECQTRFELAPPRRTARQKETGDVGACNQQRRAYTAHEQNQEGGNVAGGIGRERGGRRGFNGDEPSKTAGIGRVEAVRNQTHVGLRLRDRQAGPQSPDSAGNPASVTPGRQEV